MSERGLSHQELRVSVEGRATVSAIVTLPQKATHLFVLAHGAGAGMRHPFMERMTQHLAASGIAALRYQFPYTEAGRKRPDTPALLQATVRAAVSAGESFGLPLIAGGKSMGGRMTSQAAAESPLPRVRGLVFLGFPLHPPGVRAASRGEHLARVRLPMLFLQGTRDKLAELDLLTPLIRTIERATLLVIDGADHGFHVPRSSGRTDDDALVEMASAVASWAASVG